MPDDPAAAAPSPARPPPEARQRWRLVVARAADAPSGGQRESAAAWEDAIIAAGLPVATTGTTPPRPRISFGAPLPVGVQGEAELIDIVLAARWPTWRLREALTPVLPPGWQLVRLEDVWLGGPPLAGRVAAADYLVVVRPGADGPEVIEPARIGEACRMFRAARTVPRQRRKGEGTIRYDLRPLVVDVGVADDGPPVTIRMRTRFDPERGTGRPEEVVGAIGDLIGLALEAGSIVRERLLLGEDLDQDPVAPAPDGGQPPLD